MGKILQQMLGFLLISILLASSESFPQINDRNLRSGIKTDNLMIDEIISEVSKKVEAIKDEKKDATALETNLSPQLNGAKSKRKNTFNFNTEKVFRSIRGFTEKTIANMLKKYINNKRRYPKTNIDNSGVILGNSKTNQMMQNNFTSTSVIALAKPVSVTKYTGVSKKSGVETIKVPSPAKSKVDRWLPGLRTFRRRRSFFSDLGYGLESAFENDDTEVVFGAHTSPCDYADRHYCLNGGTCVFLGALEVKTCRCKIGYTGLRCEMINQEFLLALLSDEFFG